MSDQSPPTNDRSEKGRKPDVVAYVESKPHGDRTYLNRIGATWKHRDGHGSTTEIDKNISVSGRLVIRDVRDEHMQRYDEERRDQAMNEQERSPERSRRRERSR